MVRGTVHGRYEGSFIGGLRDFKYDLHRHVLPSLQLGDGNDGCKMEEVARKGQEGMKLLAELAKEAAIMGNLGNCL